MKHLLCLVLVLVTLAGCSTQASREEAYARALRTHVDEIAYFDRILEDLQRTRGIHEEAVSNLIDLKVYGGNDPKTIQSIQDQADFVEELKEKIALYEGNLEAQREKVHAAEDAKIAAEKARNSNVPTYVFWSVIVVIIGAIPSVFLVKAVIDQRRKRPPPLPPAAKSQKKTVSCAECKCEMQPSIELGEVVYTCPSCQSKQAV